MLIFLGCSKNKSNTENINEVNKVSDKIYEFTEEEEDEDITKEDISYSFSTRFMVYPFKTTIRNFLLILQYYIQEI